MSFDSELWWDEQGPFALLHAWMPLRMQFILEQLLVHADQDDRSLAQTSHSLQALAGLTIIDIGCGGGLVCEAMAKIGAKVIGIDIEPGAIACAKKHQEQCAKNLDITYVCANPLAWMPDAPVDAVVAFEVLEHLDDPFVMLEKMQSWLKPQGVVIGSTVNRTWFSAVVGIGLAEHVFNIVPKGTHHWADFLKPLEILGFFQKKEDVCHIQGCWYTPLTGWQYGPFLGMNYFFSARKNPCDPLYDRSCDLSCENPL